MRVRKKIDCHTYADLHGREVGAEVTRFTPLLLPHSVEEGKGDAQSRVEQHQRRGRCNERGLRRALRHVDGACRQAVRIAIRRM